MSTSVVGKKLFVGNLSYDTSDKQLEEVFSEYGEVKACFTVKERGVTDKCKGYGYVVFNSKESCNKACARVKVIKGRPVQVTLAHSKKFPQKSETTKPLISSHDNQSSDESDYEALTASTTKKGPKLRKPKSERSDARFAIGRTVMIKPLPEDCSEPQLQTLCDMENGLITSLALTKEGEISQGLVTFETHKQAQSALRKLSGMKEMEGIEVTLLSRATKGVSQSTLRKSRLIIRNISFKCSEVDLQGVFGEFGRVIEVKIPRKENGHMLGYGFVQFSSYFDASKALESVNGKPIKGRPVAVDWAVPKDRYEEALKETTPTIGGSKKKTDDVCADDDDNESEDGNHSNESENGNHSDVSEGGNHGDESVGGDCEVAESTVPSGKPPSADVDEGRTLFIRNLSVDAEYREVSQLFSQFGPIRYARVLADPQSQLSKGSAFLQFKKQSSVQPCLDVANGDGLHFHGNKLSVSLAVSKQQAQEFKGQDTRVKEDKRNLYLAKEGLILPGTPAAEELSKADMARRMRSHSERKSKLANPNYFVSKTRLSVRNLPTGTDEKSLKMVFTKSAELAPTSITQVKILRSSERVDGEGVGRSKGFGFVEFKGHEEALKTLRSTNNNPSLFGEKRRLIVEFAVESSQALHLRAQRKQRQAATTTTGNMKQPTAESAHDKKISRNQKWCQKWQAIRLKRKANNKPSTDSTELENGLTDTIQVHTTVGKGTAEVKVQKPTRGGRKRKEKNDDEKPPPKRVKRQKSARESTAEVKVQTLTGAGKKRKEKVDDENPPTGRGRKRKEKASINDNEKPPPPKKVKQQKSVVSTLNGAGRNKRRSKPETEEVSLEAMVNKYRQKLDQSSLSKWVH